MKLLSRNYYVQRGIWSALLAITLLSSSTFSAFAWQRLKAPVVASKRAAATLTAVEKKTAAKIKLETIREVTAALSSAEFEGRGTGQPGADKAANYLAQRFAKLGLKPGGENGSYLQQIKFRSAEVLPESSVKIGDVVLKHGSDYVVLPPYGAERVDVSGGLVFAGYGVVSPELKRDDLAGLDLKDKVVIIIGGEPAGVDTTAWKRATSSQVRAMNIFTRGAAAMIVANLDTQERSFKTIADYLSRRRVSLASAPAMMFKVPPVLLAGNEAMERVFAGSPVTFAQTLEKAQAGEVVSRDLEKTAAIALRFKLQETTSSNVVAVLEGSDPKLKEEAVVYSAHYDAYGIEGDGRIFPGAADNALGVATVVAIAEGLVTAFPKPSTRPRRSTVFLAVTGEEYGLFGAEYWVKHPTWPLQKVAANINFDGIGTEVYGPVKRIVGFGAEHSDLGKIFEDVTVAAGDMVAPDPMPEENAFVRSDHYAFVKQGVPALMLMGVPAGDESMWLPRARKWLETDYHSPNDTIKPDWDWTGPQTLAKVGLIIGLRVANAETMPAWKTTSPFNRLRAQAKVAGQ
jgi:peptidase M28-like protein